MQARQITKGSGHSFFGYYDIPAFSKNGKFHLYHKVVFLDRLPTGDDEAEIGIIELGTLRPHPIAHTFAWNFQQGAMLQWSRLAPDEEIIYNVYREGTYQTAIHNIATGWVRYYSRPVATISGDGRFGLSINFSRIYDFRPGYGYACLKDPFCCLKHPEEDGVFLVDMLSGSSKQILSYMKIWDFMQPIYKLNDEKIVVNHITFNHDASRFLFLVRTMVESNWVTALLTADRNGHDLRCLSTDAYTSHYHWRDNSHILMYAGNYDGQQLYLFTDKENEIPVVMDKSFFKWDGHCSYSPDRQWILYDSYQDENNFRHLYVYNIERKKGLELGKYFSDQKLCNHLMDARCDLHPRWNRDGKGISFDSFHEGTRQIYTMDLREYFSEFRSFLE